MASIKIGDATAVQKRTISTVPCQVKMITGRNSSAADLYIQLHETLDCSGTPAVTFLAAAGMDFSLVYQGPTGFDKLVVAASSTENTYTAASGTPVKIQAEILA